MIEEKKLEGKDKEVFKILMLRVQELMITKDLNKIGEIVMNIYFMGYANGAKKALEK